MLVAVIFLCALFTSSPIPGTFAIVAAAQGPIAKTQNGALEGTIKRSSDNKTFVAFEGIPYAKPPVGQLRFKEPESAEPWNGVLKANRMYTCSQFFPILDLGYSGGEDCLYINVYVPGEVVDVKRNLDVVVHIHGGAFMLGSPRMMAKPSYVMNRDVVYVAFNYRLGIFGFLSTEDEVVPGNNGLKDQTLALSWIKTNIASFGGNLNSITLTGLSAGSASVHLHMLSPKSTGLFHRAMMMSGTPLNPWAMVEKPREKAVKLAEIHGCNANSSESIVDCLREVPAKELGSSVAKFFVFAGVAPVTPFGPVVEYGGEAFLDEHPYKLIVEGKFSNDVPTIMSCVGQEGIYPVGVFTLLDKLDELNDLWNKVAPYALDYQDTALPSTYDSISQKIRQYYFKDEAITRENVMKLVKLFSDRFYFTGIQEAAKLQARTAKSPVYFYHFTYQPTQINPFPAVKGTAHTDDSKLIFELMSAPYRLSSSDHAAMTFFADLLVTFSKTGKPNTSWEPLSDSNDINYLHVYSGEDQKMETVHEFAPSDFWNSLDIMENGHLMENS